MADYGHDLSASIVKGGSWLENLEVQHWFFRESRKTSAGARVACQTIEFIGFLLNS
jgi:hypothetical protein